MKWRTLNEMSIPRTSCTLCNDAFLSQPQKAINHNLTTTTKKNLENFLSPKNRISCKFQFCWPMRKRIIDCCSSKNQSPRIISFLSSFSISTCVTLLTFDCDWHRAVTSHFVFAPRRLTFLSKRMTFPLSRNRPEKMRECFFYLRFVKTQVLTQISLFLCNFFMTDVGLFAVVN